MRIEPARFRKILNEETRRTLREAPEAHEDDLIRRAYAGGRVDSTGTEVVDSDSDNFSSAETDPENLEDSGGELGQEDNGDETENENEIEIEQPEVTDAEEEVRKSLMEEFRDSKVVDFGLDVLGTVAGYVADAAVVGSVGLGAPIAYTLAAVPDLLNSARHAARGERGEAAIYFLCALPILGEVIGPVKISMKVLGTAARAGEVYDVINMIRKATKAAKISKTPIKAIGKIKEVCSEHLPDFDIDSVADDAAVIMSGSREEVAELFDVPSKDHVVSTEAEPLAESRRRERTISIVMETRRNKRF